MELLMLCHVSPQWEDDFRAENTQIIYHLQFQLASITSISSFLSFILLHQIFIYETPILPLLLQFWRCAPEEDVQA